MKEMYKNIENIVTLHGEVCHFIWYGIFIFYFFSFSVTLMISLFILACFSHLIHVITFLIFPPVTSEGPACTPASHQLKSARNSLHEIPAASFGPSDICYNQLWKTNYINHQDKKSKFLHISFKHSLRPYNSIFKRDF